MNGLRLWFAGRSRRERQLILSAGALTVAVLVWLALLRPLGDALAAAQVRAADAAARLADTRAAVDAIRQAGRARGPALDAPLADVVRRSADEAGFAIASLDTPAPDRVRVGIASARGGALTNWLAGLERQGVLVAAVQATDHGDRTVGVDLTLVARGR